MQKPNRDAPTSSLSDSGSPADWFDPDRVPVTLRIDTFNGASWDRMKSQIQTLQTTGSPVTLCTATDAAALEGQTLADTLASSGLDCSRLQLAAAPAPGPEVLPRSPLLAPEYTSCPWSERQLMCPAETAWVPMQLSLLPYVENFARIGDSLDGLVDLAEEMHDDLDWPTDGMRRDAHLNRRLAIELLDVGRFAVGRSPSEMHRCFGWISARLQARSSDWARRRAPLPSIIHADPTRRMKASPMRDQWRSRWRTAADTYAVRHRNLLVFSPWSILDAPGPFRLDLLSLLVHADAVCLARSKDAPVLSDQQQRLIEHRLTVALQQRQALDQIAKHI